MAPKPLTSEPTGLRPWVSNATWDAAAMLRKAVAGAYPSAKNPATRDAEIAYWTMRAEHGAHHEEEDDAG